MSQLAHQKAIASTPPTSHAKADSRSFRGFVSPTSNTTYTPNQFFDVCVRHSSRGVVRLVAYLIRKTLGWCDAQGNPQNERILVSYQDLVNNAGISREMIRQTLNEAVAGHYIRCIQDGRAKAAADAGQSALYELCWDDSHEYVKDPKRFRGFFEGEGNRTDIPNEFFDRLIPHETLAVIKAVGTIIRFSIGFQARRGVRRQHVQLSYSDIQRYGRIVSRATISEALATALRHNYIICLEQGVFDRDAGRLSRAAVYALKWADGFGGMIGQESNPTVIASFSDHRPDFRTGDQSEISTEKGQKNEPEDRSENRPDIEMKHKNETSKQQSDPVDADLHESFELLNKQGFDAKSARALARQHSKAEIKKQIEWLPVRMPERNPLGMLRVALEENWPNPRETGENFDSPGAVFAAHFYAGFAGNNGEPTAEPSKRDTMLAERYVKRIHELAPEEMDSADLGRDFGHMTREAFPIQANNPVSIAWALRVLGDTFYLRCQNRLAAQKAVFLAAARKDHEQRYWILWLQYLQAEERRFKDEDSKEYARFEAQRAGWREQIVNSPWKMGIAEHLARFDSSEQRIIAFQAFFKDQVHDFWAWDKGMNPEPFNQLASLA